MISFRTWLEAVTRPVHWPNQSRPLQQLIIAANGETFGQHASAHGNYEDETPADDPTENAQWFVLLKPEAWPLIKDKDVTVEIAKFGSYHERWFRLRAYVSLDNYEDEEKLNGLKISPENFINYSIREASQTRTFKFTTLPDAIKKLHTLAATTHSENDPGDANSGQYWDRMTQSYLAGRVWNNYDPHNPSDAYWKK